MWPDLIKTEIPYADLAFRGVTVYLSVVILLRISGKRQLGQMNATEFVAILLISNSVQNAMNGGDNSLSGGLVLAAVLIFVSWLLSFATFRSEWMSRIFEGSPTLIIHDGKIVEKNRRKEMLSIAEILTLLRKQGIQDLADIKTGILEADGHLSVTKFSDLKAKDSTQPEGT